MNEDIANEALTYFAERKRAIDWRRRGIAICENCLYWDRPKRKQKDVLGTCTRFVVWLEKPTVWTCGVFIARKPLNTEK
jgi:hypothetical protein